MISYSSLEQLDDIVKRLSTGGKRPKTDESRDAGTVDIEELLARDESIDGGELASDNVTAPIDTQQ